jgi:vacuolar iron transporter family protein
MLRSTRPFDDRMIRSTRHDIVAASVNRRIMVPESRISRQQRFCRFNAARESVMPTKNSTGCHVEHHRGHHIGWLRAAVLGANDGAISTASLVVGVAAAKATVQSVVVAGLAGLAAGAMAMAAGEYVSVSSQADTERADLTQERRELTENVEFERKELADIYVARGLTSDLAAQVAIQLMQHDALGAHARDELGITVELAARPVQAALASAASFTVGAAVPLLVICLFPVTYVIPGVFAATICELTVLGAVAAKIGGAPVWVGARRVAFWGALAMAVTAGVGLLFHIAA